MSGRAVPNVSPINREDIPDTIEFVSQLTDIPVEDLHPLGSVCKVPTSGDLDLGVCSLVHNADEIHNYLISVLGEQSCTYNKGTGVRSYSIEIGGDISKGFVQADLIYTPNIEWVKFAYFSDPTKSKYKGAIRTMLLMGIAATINQLEIDYFKYDNKGRLMVRAGRVFDLNNGLRRIFQYRKKKKKSRKGYLKSMTTVTRPEFEKLFPALCLRHQPTVDCPNMALDIMFGEPGIIQPEHVETAEQVLVLIHELFDKERQQSIFEKAATRVTKGKFVLPPEIEAYVK